MSKLNIGQIAPDFEGESTQGSVRLSELHGQKVVLYFYPRDNTPGCTTEASDFRDQVQAFTKTDCVILGVSRDTMTSHQKFHQKLDLPFALIADPEETICNLYGVMKEKMMYGRQVRTIERSTFLLDREGQLVQIWRKVKVPGHVAEVLEQAQSIA